MAIDLGKLQCFRMFQDLLRFSLRSMIRLMRMLLLFAYIPIYSLTFQGPG